jgi:hypothetical protein
LLPWIFILNLVVGVPGVEQTYFILRVGPFASNAECAAVQAGFNIPPNPPVLLWSKTPCVQQ